MYFSKRRRKSFPKRRLLRFNSNTSPSTHLRRPEPALAGRASVLGKRTFGAIPPPALFSPCRGRVGLPTTSPSNAPSSLRRVDAVERKPCAQWAPPAPTFLSPFSS